MRCLTAGWLVAGGVPAWAQAASADTQAALPVTVDAAEVRARPDRDVEAQGNVRFRQGAVELSADRVSYDAASDVARAQGHVTIMRDGNRYSGDELELALQRFEGYFLNPTYFFSRAQAGGSATRVDFLSQDVAVATGGTYTSCPRDGPAGPDWLLSTDRVRLDFANNEGIAEGAVLRFYGVPILVAPTLSFPITDARKSGWLPPALSLDNKSGVQLAVPYYWNIAPNRDATLTPAVISKRGLGLGSEFRYLESGYAGSLNMNVLANDRLTGHTRSAFALQHEGVLFGDGAVKANVARVSDDDYWKDFPQNVASLTPRLLAADVQADKTFGHWKTYARVQRWQVLQVAQPPTNAADNIVAPYDRLPQIGVHGAQRLGPGMELALEGELNHFVNPAGALDASVTASPTRYTGLRAHALGSLSWPYVTPGWTLVPKVAINAASYALDQPLSGAPFDGRTRFGRSIPTFSLESAWVLERDAAWVDRPMRQTLEPQLMYVRTPYYAQSSLPNFDSAGKDFNFDSIYAQNDFSGVDRVSDANQLTVGATTRLLDASNGAEVLRLGLAQRISFSDQFITPAGAPTTQRLSDLLLLGSTTLVPHWNLDAGWEYTPGTHLTQRSVMAVRYSPGPYRTVNLAYRFNRDTFSPVTPGSSILQSNADGSEQVDLGWQWPIYGITRDQARRSATGSSCSGTLYGVGRTSYSLRDSRMTDAVVGLEYDAGCWIGRLVGRRLSTGQQEATTQIGLEIEFVGLSHLGTNPLKLLKDNIPGYRLLRDEPVAPTAPSNLP